MKTLLMICAVIGVASCSAARGDICATVPQVEDDIGKVEDVAANMRDSVWLERRAANCLIRWGYRLAPSADDGLTIAKAVMQACSGAVNDHAANYAETLAKHYEESHAPGVVDALERSDYAEDRRTERLIVLEREAHFRVQQGKAGKCKV